MLCSHCYMVTLSLAPTDLSWFSTVILRHPRSYRSDDRQSAQTLHRSWHYLILLTGLATFIPQSKSLKKSQYISNRVTGLIVDPNNQLATLLPDRKYVGRNLTPSQIVLYIDTKTRDFFTEWAPNFSHFTITKRINFALIFVVTPAPVQSTDQSIRIVSPHHRTMSLYLIGFEEPQTDPIDY